MERTPRRLYRSREESRLAGICGGLGDYLGADPVVIRLVWVLVTCFTGVVPGTVAYLVAWVVVPQEPAAHVVEPSVAQPHDNPA